MKKTLEEVVCSLFKCLNMTKLEEKIKIKEENIYQFQYERINNIVSYDFEVSPEKLNEELTKAFEEEGRFIHVDDLKNYRITYLFRVLFKKILDSKTDIEYAKSFFDFIVKVSNSEKNNFPSDLFNIFFLSSIERSQMLSSHYIFKKEKEILLKKIDLWCKLIGELNYNKKIPTDYIYYAEHKMTALSFYHYLAILSKYENKTEEYKKLFNLEMAKCINEIDLRFYSNPSRLRTIKLKNIPIEVFKEHIGVKALEEFFYCLNEGSKFEKTLNQIISNIKLK